MDQEKKELKTEYELRKERAINSGGSVQGI
jgi:hypothetical protein